MKKIRSRKAVPLSSREQSQRRNRIFLYFLLFTMFVSTPWIFPQLLNNNQILILINKKTSSDVISPDVLERISEQNDESRDANKQASLPLPSESDEPIKNSQQLIENAITETIGNEVENAKPETELEEPQGADAEDEAVLLGESKIQYMTVDESYFDDALFIGDSRTVGIYEYANSGNADFFCNTGLSSYTVLTESIPVKGVGQIKLLDLLAQKKYGKIYITLGINEIGNQFEEIMQKYNQLVVAVQEANPGSIIYLQGIIHVAQKKSSSHSYITNPRIDILNAYIQGDADNITVFYLNPNEQFDDVNGNLKEELTGDGVHFYAKYYQEWVDWLKTKAVARSDT